MTAPATEIEAAPPQERSFSTAPRKVPARTAAELERLRHLETEIATGLEAALDRHASRLALIARAGSDISTLKFEGEQPYYTHVGFALRQGGEWRVHQLLNTHQGREGHLYRQSLEDFFRDDPFEYRAGVLVPSPELQHGIAAILESPLRERLHSPSYSRISYPFSTRYQSCNQWVAEVIGAAQGSATSRQEAQEFLRARGLQPSTLLTVGLGGQMVSRLITRNTRFDDHPLRDRLRGRLSFMMDGSLKRYLERSDSLIGEATVQIADAPDAAGGAREGTD